ncbi:hypothetical protein ANRL4_00531, partial [Anaerolineae bacterium]
EPIDLGSAGGSGESWGVHAGGNGGGAIQLVVTGTLTVDGVLSANGLSSSTRAGGGSGGSLWITTGALAGSGVIQANGGAGQGGGGAGGRIAIYYGGTLPISLTEQVVGGTGGVQAGGNGTIYLESTSINTDSSTIEAMPEQVVANGVATATITVTMKNMAGQPMANKPVIVGLVSGGPAYINGQLVVPPTMYATLNDTDANGISIGVITATLTGERIIFGRSGTDVLQDNAVVTFLAGPPDAAHSSLAVSRSTAPADGVTPVTVTITVRDAFSNPVPDVTVVISATEHAQVNQPALVTNASGQTVGTVVDTQGETVIVSAGAGIPIAATASITFVSADVTMVKAGPAAVGLGQPITYTLTIRNAGMVTAQNVVVTDTLPDQVSYLADTAPITMTQTGQTLVWNLDALPPNGVVNYQVVGNVSLDAPAGTHLINRAEASTSTNEESLINNSSEVTTTLVTADLAVSSNGPTVIGIGLPITYTVTIRNIGLAVAQQVLVTDVLPNELIYLSDTAPVTTTQIDQTMIWALGSLAPGATVNFNVVAQASNTAVPGASVVNTI